MPLVVLALSLLRRLDAGGIMGRTFPVILIKVNLIRLGPMRLGRIRLEHNALGKITLGANSIGAGLLYPSGLDLGNLVTNTTDG